MTIWLKPREYDEKFFARADLSNPASSIDFGMHKTCWLSPTGRHVCDLPAATMDEFARFAEDLVAEHYYLPHLAVYFGRVIEAGVPQ